MIKRLLGGNFAVNVVRLTFGAAMGQAVMMISSPLLTRLYQPEDFGVLALFVSVTSIVSSLSTGRYEQAIVLAKSRNGAFNTTAVAVLIGLITSTLLLFVLLGFSRPIATMMGNSRMAGWLLLAPLMVLLDSLFNAFYYLQLRLNNLRKVVRVPLLRSVVTVLVQVSLGFLKMGTGGLIAGQILAALTAVLGLFSAQNLRNHLRIVSWRRIKAMAKRHANFPRYTLAAGVVGTLCQNALLFSIANVFSTSTLGYFNLTHRVLAIPSIMIGTSVQRMLYQRISELANEGGGVVRFFDKVMLRLILMSVLMYGGLYLFAEDLFVLVFGEMWRESGRIAAILIPLYGIRFVAVPLASVYHVFGKQKQDLYWNLAQFAIVLATAYAAKTWKIELHAYLGLYVTSMIAISIVLIFLSRRYTCNHEGC